MSLGRGRAAILQRCNSEPAAPGVQRLATKVKDLNIKKLKPLKKEMGSPRVPRRASTSSIESSSGNE